MRRASGAAAVLILLAACTSPPPSTESSAPPTSQALTPGIAKAVEMIKSRGWSKTLVFLEIDDEPPSSGAARLEVVGRLAGEEQLMSYVDSDRTELFRALMPDLPAPGAPGWRSLVIIVEGQDVTVETGPRGGPMATYSTRMNALIDRVF